MTGLGVDRATAGPVQAATTVSSWDALVAADASRLAGAAVPSPRTDAELLAAHVAGVDRGRLRVLVLTGAAAGPAERAAFDAAVDRRATREPLQHITGLAPFRHLVLAVGPGVFVPRPETELLAGWAVAAAADRLRAGDHDHDVDPHPDPDPDRPGVSVVDLGTGSGAIAAAVATEVPGATVVAVEIDPAAAVWAHRNLDPLGVPVLVADARRLPELRPELCGTVDVLVTNPPYIPLDAWESVPPEVRDHDPAAALWGGADGLETVRALLRCARRLLRPGGVLGIEHADAQGASVPALLAAAGVFGEVRDHRDLSGRARYTTARLRVGRTERERGTA